MFWKGKTRVIARFYRTGLDIYSHFREGKNLSYSQVNRVIVIFLNYALGLNFCFRIYKYVSSNFMSVEAYLHIGFWPRG